MICESNIPATPLALLGYAHFGRVFCEGENVQGLTILGGDGKRLGLLTRRVTNKALTLVYDHLVIEYPLNTLVKAGIKEMVAVIGGRHNGSIVNTLGDSVEFGVTKMSYVYQKDPKGISHAIYQAKGHISNKVAVILGDNFFEDDITPYVKEFEKQEKGCAIFTKEVPDPERYGVAEVDNLGNVLNIIEKPKNPKTNLAVTGLYFYDNTLFDKIETLKPSARGELEVTDLNMLYVKEGTCKAYPIKGYWNDMGTFDSLLETANFVKDKKFELSYKIDAWSNTNS